MRVHGSTSRGGGDDDSALALSFIDDSMLSTLFGDLVASRQLLERQQPTQQRSEQSLWMFEPQRPSSLCGGTPVRGGDQTVEANASKQSDKEGSSHSTHRKIGPSKRHSEIKAVEGSSIEMKHHSLIHRLVRYRVVRRKRS